MVDEASETKKSSSSDSLNYPSIPDADREMAALAFQEFEQDNYEQSLSYLKKLLLRRPQDLKVYHNYSVVEYYLTNFKKTEQFNKKLQDICKQAHVVYEDLESLDDVDYCIALYNQAIVFYHLHQYHSAIHIAQRLYKFIEPLEETLSRNVLFLLIECYLCIYQPKKAQSLVGVAEQQCPMGKIRPPQREREETGESPIMKACNRRMQLFKARCYAMIKTSKACKREIKNLMSSGSQIQNISAFYLKSQLEYQRGNYRKALKLLNSVALPDDLSKYFQQTGDCIPAIFYNNVGCIHFHMGKPNLGQFYLNKAIQAFDSDISTVTNSKESKSNIRPLHLMCTSTRLQLVYNLGMQFLQAQKFTKAFSCFMEVVGTYHSNPRLWLRIAECCIHIHKPDNTEQFVEYKGKSFIKTIVGAGPHRKLVINSLSDKLPNEESKNVSSDLVSPTLHCAMMCLKNALYLVKENATACVEPGLPMPEEPESEDNLNLPVLPSNILQGAEILSLRNSILIASSYVALCLGDVVLAHEYAKTLLSQAKISGAHKFLAHLYAGESLLVMDRITEAVEHLNFQYTTDIELAFPVNSTEISLKHQLRFDSKLNEKNDDGSRPVGNIPNWFPNTISSAKFITQYNLAVAYAVREEWTKALECLQQMNPGGNVPSQAMSLLIYVQSHQGSAEETKTYVQRYIVPITV